MTIIYFSEKSDPVYNEYGYIAGCDSVKQGYITCKDSEADEMEMRMAENERLSDVHSQQVPDELYIS